MRYLIAAFLSAALIWFAMQLNNPAVAEAHQTSKPHRAAITPTAPPPSAPVKVRQTADKVSVKAPPQEPKHYGGCASYDSLFRQYDWDVSVAEAICQAESGGNPNAVSPPNYDGLRDYGLMQIHGQAILNPSANIARAHQKYLSQGWNAWTTYNTGDYLAFL